MFACLHAALLRPCGGLLLVCFLSDDPALLLTATLLGWQLYCLLPGLPGACKGQHISAGFLVGACCTSL